VIAEHFVYQNTVWQASLAYMCYSVICEHTPMVTLL
jgi:hypothetical protein